jgi:hypothetical protein
MMGRTFRVLPHTGLLFLLCLAAARFVSAQEPPASSDTPTASQQTAMLAQMTRYAERYVDNLPNFLCVLVTEQYEANKKGEHWHKGDTLTSRLAYNEGREQRTLVQVNDRSLNQVNHRWRTPLTTEGEFGRLIQMIFEERTQAAFEWNRWDNLHGKRVAVFNYSVEQQRSTMKLGLSDLASAIVPYHGLVFADPDAGAIYQVYEIATEIPKALRTREIGTTIEYSEVSIGDAKYLLPARASILMKTDQNQVRNELEFRDYRKFGAESSITFGDSNGSEPSPAPPPKDSHFRY